MAARLRQNGRRKASAAFTLVEVVMAIAILALVMAGMIYGYVQTNYRAEWSSMSMAAQSFAAEAVERARAAQWDYFRTYTNQIQQLPSPSNPTNTYNVTNTMLVPSSGRTTNVVTKVTISNISTGSAPLYQLRADCVW
jgi:prepilin-type N-terminal cleavage/methylation domain-containing protein